jgi:dephospho-CoA kinase
VPNGSTRGRIVGVAGLCGAGKSTAVAFLAQKTGGEVVYLGGAILRFLRERGLPQTSESEQVARVDLRRQHGPAFLAIAEAEHIRAIVTSGRSVFLDAVYVGEEFEFLSTLAEFALIGIDVSFVTRLERIRTRPVRPLTETELRARDAIEMTKLNAGAVLAKANFTISNEGSMSAFETELTNILKSAALPGRAGIGEGRSNLSG